jgi:nicotinamidase/pyrazinamidase
MIDFTPSALRAIDGQNDCCPAYTAVSREKRPSGALAVKRGDEVIGPLTTLGARELQAGGSLITAQDGHPQGHGSFASVHPGKSVEDTLDLPGIGGQVLWPDQGVQGSRGPSFHDRFNLNPVSLILCKGFRRDLDSYSAFFENNRKTPTGLDAVPLGYKTLVLIDGVRGVDYPEGSVERAFNSMEDAGIILVDSKETEGNL